MQAKYDADKDLVKRSFDWFILRPTSLTDDEAIGKASIGSQIRISGKIAVRPVFFIS